eukprot:g13305.t1
MKVVEGAHRVERPGSPKGFDVHVEDEMSREVGVRRVRLAPASRLYRSRTAEKVRDRYSRVDGESDETEKEGPQFLPILVAWEPGLTKADFDPAESELDFATRVSSNIATTRSSSVSAKESCASPPPTCRETAMSEEVKRKTIALIDHLPKHRQTLLRQMLAFCLKSVCDREELAAVIQFFGGYEATALRFMRHYGFKLAKAKVALIDAIRFRCLVLPKILTKGNCGEFRQSGVLVQERILPIQGVPFGQTCSMEELRSLVQNPHLLAPKGSFVTAGQAALDNLEEELEKRERMLSAPAHAPADAVAELLAVAVAEEDARSECETFVSAFEVAQAGPDAIDMKVEKADSSRGAEDSTTTPSGQGSKENYNKRTSKSTSARSNSNSMNLDEDPYSPDAVMRKHLRVFLAYDGHPVEYWQIKHLFLDQMFLNYSEEEVQQAYLNYLEAKERLLRATGSRCTTLLLDCTGVTFSQMTSSMRYVNRFVKACLTIGDTYYPDSVQKSFVLNTPFVAPVKMTIACLAQSTRESVRILGKGGGAEADVPAEILTLLPLEDFRALTSNIDKVAPQAQAGT